MNDYSRLSDYDLERLAEKLKDNPLRHEQYAVRVELAGREGRRAFLRAEEIGRALQHPNSPVTLLEYSNDHEARERFNAWFLDQKAWNRDHFNAWLMGEESLNRQQRQPRPQTPIWRRLLGSWRAPRV